MRLLSAGVHILQKGNQSSNPESVAQELSVKGLSGRGGQARWPASPTLFSLL